MSLSSDLQAYLNHLVALPNGTMLPVRGIAEQLQRLVSEHRRPELSEVLHNVPSTLSPRERFWAGPAEVRLNARELAEAIGKPISWVHKRTSFRSGLPLLPHTKRGHSLVFVVGEVREWLNSHATVRHQSPMSVSR